MKVKSIILAALLPLAAQMALAQSDGDVRNLVLSSEGTPSGLSYGSADTGFDTGAWISGGLDWDIIPKKLGISFDEEIRLKDNFSNPNKAYTNAALEFRALPWLKAETSYSFILTKNSSDVWKKRHRAAFGLTATARFGRWKLSLREKLQATYKDYDVNLSQTPQTDLALKSRLKLSLDLRHSKWEPYVSAEIRNTLNAVNPASFVYGTYNWQKYSSEDSGWNDKSRICYGNLTPSYNDIYINRLRFIAGTEWKYSRNQVLDMFLILDCSYDLPVDFSANGIQKSYSSYLEDNPSSKVSEANYYKYGVGILTLKDSYFAGVGLSWRFKL